MKRRFRDLQALCRTKSWEVWRGLDKVVGLAVELVAGADGLFSSGAQSVLYSRIAELDEQVANTRVPGSRVLVEQVVRIG